MLNFERFKWGGVRRDDLAYVAFDLQQFRHAPRVKSTVEDIALGRALLKTLGELPTATTAVEAVRHLKMLKGNKADREVLMDIWASAASSTQTSTMAMRLGSCPPYGENSRHIGSSTAPTPHVGGKRRQGST